MESGKSSRRQPRHPRNGDDSAAGPRGGRVSGIPSLVMGSPSNAVKPKLEDIHTTISKLSDTVKSGFADQKSSHDGIVQRQRTTTTSEAVSNCEVTTEKTQRRVKLQELRIKSLEKRLEDQERESRRKLLLIEGVKEGKEESVDNIIGELFDDLLVGFGTERCDRAQRRGKQVAPPGKSSRPRPIVISFIRLSDKLKIFKFLKNLKDQDKWKGVSIGDDLTETQRDQVRDLLALSAYTRSKGHEAAVRGNFLVVDGTRYRYEDLSQLPEGLTLCKAKTIEVDWGKGLAFQSHHSPMSNMYYCQVDYEGRHFESLEIAYQYPRAKVCGYKTEADLIADCTNSYKAKSIGAPLKDTKEWLGCRVRVMTELVRLKFENNLNCKQWLLQLEGKKLYEATADKFWATGLFLSKSRDIKEGKIPGQNKLGEILEKVRTELKKNKKVSE